MKKKLKCLALALALVLFATSIPTSFQALAEEETSALDYVYNAADDFSTEQNPNGAWSYQYRTSESAEYTDLAYVVDNRWQDISVETGWKAIVTKADADTVTATSGSPVIQMSPQDLTVQNVLTFTAPYSGSITVHMTNGGVFAPTTTMDSNAVWFKMLHNSEAIVSEEGMDASNNLQGSRVFTGTETLQVEQGDVIRFVVGRNKAVGATTYFNPEIKYTEVYTKDFNAADDFSLDSNPNGVWSYQYRTSLTGSFENMALAENGSEWVYFGTGAISTRQLENVTYLQTPVNAVDKEVAVTFTAPYAGKIKVSMAGNGKLITENANNRSYFTLIHNDTKLITDADITSTGYEFDQITLHVAKGDNLYFAIRRYVAGSAGKTFFIPEISYTEIFADSYQAGREFSLQNNPSGVWSYQYRADTTAAFTDMTAMNDAETEWQCSVGAMSSIKKVNTTYVHAAASSATGQVALTFKASYSGKIKIAMTNNMMFTENAIHQSYFTLLHNDTKVITNALITSTGYEFDEITLDVKAGDKVYFAFQRIASGTAGRSYLNPEIYFVERYNDNNFNAANEFSYTNNPSGVWSYQYRTSLTGSFAKMALAENGSEWVYSGTGAISTVGWSNATYLQTPVNATDKEVAVTFTAPYTGKIKISMAGNGKLTTAGANQYSYFTLMHNDTKLITDAYITSTGYEFDEITLHVVKGDNLYFAIRRYATGSAGKTYFIPDITYSDIVSNDATTYYISSTTGQDGFHGTNRYAPWASFNNLKNVELTEGDRIYLMSGDEWTTQMVLNNVSGTENNPVVISSYGVGNKPRLSCSVAEDETTNTLETANAIAILNDVGGLEIDGLQFAGAEDGTRARVGIHLNYTNTFNHEYVKIKNCDFADLTGFDIRDYRGTSDRSNKENITGVYRTASAIALSASNYNIGVTDPALIGLYIDNCTTTNCGTLLYSAGSVLETNEAQSIMLHGLYITDCTMTGNDYYGTVIAGVNGGYMSGCVIDGCGAAEGFSPGTAGIMISAKDFAIVNTEITGQLRGGCNYDGVAIDFEHLCDNVSVRNCYIHDNGGSGVFFYDSGAGSDHANTNCSVTNTLFVNNATEAIGTSLRDDPFADIRITSATGHALTNSTIADNKYFNNVSKTLLSYEFIYNYGNSSADETTVQQIQNNAELSEATSEYLEDKAVVLTEVQELFDEYNKSQKTFEQRVGSKQPEFAIVDSVAFKHSEDFGNAKWDGIVWVYKYYTQTNGWQDMTWDDTNSKWQYGSTTAFVTATGMHPHSTGQTVLTFVAPESGRIRISMEDAVTVSANSADGVYITVLDKELQTIADPLWVTANNSKAFTETYTQVQAGDIIYFCLSKCETPASDGTTIKPVVEYVYNDINMDDTGTLDVKDLVRMKKMIQNESTAGEADFDGDGKVTTVDFAVLQRYLISRWQ